MKRLKVKIKYWINDIYKLGFYHIFSANILTTVVGFASQLFVVWILTAEEIGQIRIMQSFLSYAILIGGVGFNSSTLKLCSENRPVGETVYLYNKSLRYSSIISIFILLIFISLNYSGFLIQNKDFRNPLSLFFISVIPLVINSIDTAYLQSIREFRKLARITFISRIISILFIISFTYYKGIYGFITANIIGNISSSLLLLFTVKRINNKIKPVKVINPFQLHFKYSSFSLLSNLTYQISLYFDMILLNYLVKDSPNAIGSYGFATLIISFFMLFTNSFQQVVIPLFSNSSSSLVEWKGLFKKYKKIYLFTVTLIGIIGITTLPFLLEFVFGNKFQSIGLFFSILIFAWVLQSLYSFKSSALFGLGKLKVIFFSSLSLVIIGLPLNYLMITKYGVIGASIGILSTSIIGLVIYNFAYLLVINNKFNSPRHLL